MPAMIEAVAAGRPVVATRFPHGIAYAMHYDTTRFVSAAMHDVVVTLIEALALVVFVVFIFLQSWRATIIPMIAIPVSLVATLAVMEIFGFSLNMLSLLGMVLAIGLVVDDAIVVVENVERQLEAGLPPLAARWLQHGPAQISRLQLAHNDHLADALALAICHVWRGAAQSRLAAAAAAQQEVTR